MLGRLQKRLGKNKEELRKELEGDVIFASYLVSWTMICDTRLINEVLRRF